MAEVLEVRIWVAAGSAGGGGEDGAGAGGDVVCELGGGKGLNWADLRVGSSRAGPQDWLYGEHAETAAELGIDGRQQIRLTAEEQQSLRSQTAILKTGRGQHRKYPPYVFTEHGSIMAATILNSQTAIEMSVHVVRAFVSFRQILASNSELASRLRALERSVAELDANTRKEFVRVYKSILKMMGPASPEQ